MKYIRQENYWGKPIKRPIWKHSQLYALKLINLLTKNEWDAEIYLMDTTFTLAEQKSMYAATWTLLAMTRAIDTLYMKISDKNSEFGKAIVEYAKANPGKFKLYND